MSKFDLDTHSVRKLAEILKDTGLSEIEYVEGENRIKVVGAVAPTVQTVQAYAPAPVAAQAAAPAAEAVKAAPAAVKGTVVPSPMVGTVYMSSEPGAAAFIKVGDKVKAGDTLLIIEAMKVMNPIKAPIGGVIVEILAENSKPVEFGEPLVTIE